MMNKSIQLSLLLLVAVIVADRVISISLSVLEERIMVGQGVGKVNAFLNQKDSVSLLVLGSSRAGHHVDPSRFDYDMFNMGVDGTNIAYASALASTLNKQGQLVLIHVDHDVVYDSDYDGHDAHRLLYKIFENDVIDDYFRHYFLKEYILAKLINTYAFNGIGLPILKSNFFGGQSYIKDKGFEPLRPSADQEIVFQNLIMKGGQDYEFNLGIENPLKISKTFDVFVKKIINDCKSKGSIVVFFTSPSLHRVDGDVKKTTQNYFETKGILYLDDGDLFQDAEISFWKDFTHLSDSGASAYSIYLNSVLVAKGIEPPCELIKPNF